MGNTNTICVQTDEDIAEDVTLRAMASKNQAGATWFGQWLIGAAATPSIDTVSPFRKDPTLGPVLLPATAKNFSTNLKCFQVPSGANVLVSGGKAAGGATGPAKEVAPTHETTKK